MNTPGTFPKNSPRPPDPMAPTFEDAARAGDARRMLATRLEKHAPTTMTFFGATRTETITLPPVAVAALIRILAHFAAGRGVSLTPHDGEIELDDAALLAGLDPLDFLESLTRLRLPLRRDGAKVFIGTDVLAACLEVIETADARVLPVLDDAACLAPIADPQLAKELLTHRQWHFTERLAHDLRKAGNTRIPETYPLDYYFGTRPLLGVRPASWPPLPVGSKV